MNEATWERVKQIFHEVMARPLAERYAFLDEACAGDAAVRSEVEELLAAHDDIGESVTARAAPTLKEAAGAIIGRYKLLQRIGEGGFGVVYMAEQEEPVRRRVALKIIKLGMDTKQVIARFEAERQALAMMEHPNIARVFDAGATETGRPYFVMELVKGVPITEYCDANTLSTRERLDLFMEVCGAVQHAHQKGIIHRDIKPSNVLVTLHDGKPVPMVIDFGIAKATHQRLTEKTLFTEYGQFIGTPVYMSPEQAEMSGLDIDTRSDIYSLGVLLYELLTGTTPLELKALREAGYGEIQRIIREDEPPKPSTRLSTLGGALTNKIAKQRKTEPGALTRLVRGDLDWIVMKALEKDRTRRYASASEFSADVARHVGDEPVTARSPSAAYKFRKYVKKHKGPVAAVAGIVVTALLLGSMAFWQGTRAQHQAMRVRANSILASSEATEDPLLKALLIEEIAEVPELPERLRIAREIADSPLPLAVFRGHEGVITRVAFSFDGTRVATASRDGTARVWPLEGTGTPIVLRGHEGAIWGVAFSPDGRLVATASADGTARLWRADGTGEAVTLRWEQSRRAATLTRSVAFSPDGERVVTASGDGTVRVWRADGTGGPIVLRGHEKEKWVIAAVFSPDGTRVVSASEDGTARIWLADGTGEPTILRGHEKRLWWAEFNPDGTRVVTASEDGTARIWLADGTGEPTILRGHEKRLFWAEFSPDGTRVVTASEDGTARVWRADGTGEPVILRGHADSVWRAEFSPDGTRVVTASEDGTSRLWHADGTGESVILQRHEGAVWAAAFSPDGNLVVTASGDGTARVWGAHDAGETVVLDGEVQDAKFSPDGTHVVTAGDDDTAQIWRADGTGEPVILRGHTDWVTAAEFSPDGNRVVTTSYDGTARIWHADGTGEPVVLEGHEGPLKTAVFSPDGTHVVTAGWDETARIWRADGTGEPVVLEGDENAARVERRFVKWLVRSAAFSPDGTQVVTAFSDGTARIWNADGTGEPVILDAREEGVWKVDFSPDGTRVVTVSGGETARVWPADGTGEPVILRGHTGGLMAAEFSPDGNRVVTTSLDSTARVWWVDGTSEPVVLRGHSDEVYAAAFSPDGTRVVTTSLDGTARVWRTDGTGEPVVLGPRSSAVLTAAFSPDGSRVLTVDSDGTARVRRITWPALLEYLRANVKVCLIPKQRQRFLAESAPDAWAAYVECERRHGREAERSDIN